MATTEKFYQPTHPGRLGQPALDKYHVPPEDGAGAYLAALKIAEYQKIMFPKVGHGLAYAAGQWTIVTGGTGDAIADSVSGGLLVTAASDDNFDSTYTSVTSFTPASGKVMAMRARFKVSAITGIGLYLGFATGGADAALPFGTNYTDVVAIRKAIASALVLGHVRGNSDTAANTGTLGTMVNDTEVDVALYACPHATQPWGAFVYNGTVTPFTTAQLAQLVLLLTSPQTMHSVIHVTGVTGTNPTLDVVMMDCEVDI
jgi:hypothetical protein